MISIALVIWRLLKYRREFAAIIASASSAHSHLNKSRFIRLLGLSMTMLFIFLPVGLYLFIRDLNFPHVQFSWSRIHGPNWNEIEYAPSGGQVTFDRWIQVGSGVPTFLLFGFGKDAVSTYRGWLLKLGFGRCFPKLQRPNAQGTTYGSATRESKTGSQATTIFGSVGDRLGSVGSRARLLYPRRSQSGRKESVLSNTK